MVGAQSRVAARGNVFSFMMPHEDILVNLKKSVSSTTRVPLPHDGSVLAILLRVHIVGGSTDVTQHLKEVHIRPEVVVNLLEELIARGFPGYENYSVAEVKQRTSDLFGDEPHAEFIPEEVRADVQAWADKATLHWLRSMAPTMGALGLSTGLCESLR